MVLSLLNALIYQALEALDKNDIREIRSYGRPPTLVQKVMEAVMVLKHAEPTWVESKRQLGKMVMSNLKHLAASA